ncbi:phosphodiesterase [Microbacterium sp. NPDC078428]|uniref:phosphodiesterase n=1 Tax=Microbacterium sp. NPDC078428 TaxID=3364190 RepID=UPI0037C9DBCF
MSNPIGNIRIAEYGRPSHRLVHLSDTHLRADGDRLYGTIDAGDRLARALAQLEASDARPDALIFTGDLADYGQAAAYDDLRAIVEPVAARLEAPVIWAMGNHDDRATFRARLSDDGAAATAPVDTVHEIDGLRVIVLDTTVPGHHHGELRDEQLEWLALELVVPAPHGTVLVMHHPPVPCVLDLAVTVELRAQPRLAHVLRGSDVRTILAGHLHYSTSASFAGIPVSVASATCYTQDLGVPAGGTRPWDAAQSFNLVHVYDETIVHSVVPVAESPALAYVDATETERRLADAGVVIPESAHREPREAQPPTMPLRLVR